MSLCELFDLRLLAGPETHRFGADQCALFPTSSLETEIGGVNKVGLKSGIMFHFSKYPPLFFFKCLFLRVATSHCGDCYCT